MITQNAFHAVVMATDFKGREHLDHFADDYSRYKTIVITAIEMSTINHNGAKEQLLKADEIYSHLMPEGLKTTGKIIGNNMARQGQIMANAIEIFIIISLATPLITFIIGRTLSGTMRKEFETTINAMTNLANGMTNVPIPQRFLRQGREIKALASGLDAFKQNLHMNHEHKIELEKNNTL